MDNSFKPLDKNSPIIKMLFASDTIYGHADDSLVSAIIDCANKVMAAWSATPTHPAGFKIVTKSAGRLPDIDDDTPTQAMAQCIPTPNGNLWIPGGSATPTPRPTPLINIQFRVPTTAKCECGAHKDGYKDFGPGHFLYCDVHSSKKP